MLTSVRGLCLLTTAYVGMAAAVVVVGFALPALPRRQTWPALATAALTAALFAVPYTLLFVAGDTGSRGYGDIQSTLDLAALAPITPEGLRSDFGRTLAPAAALPALLLAAFVLRCRGREPAQAGQGPARVGQDGRQGAQALGPRGAAGRAGGCRM